MRKIVSAIKQGDLIAACHKSYFLFLCFVILFLVRAETLFSAGYKVNDRTRVYTTEITPDSIVLKIDNDFSVPVSAKFSMELDNLQGEGLSEYPAIVPAKSVGYILYKFRKTDVNKSYKCSYNWTVVLGDVTKIADANFTYEYPFQKGSNYKISQGPGGAFSHKDMFAFDFAMPAGTPVVASRDGIVALTRSDSFTGGADKKYMDDANFISIYHSDGTMANYLHLNTGGVLVKEGQFVKKGELIGYSGNTGFSSGPHLHFEVVQPGADFKNNKYVAFNWEARSNGFFAHLFRTHFVTAMLVGRGAQ